MIALRLAVRNLLRNRWRSGLTLGGIAVAVGMMVWALSFYEGWIAQLVRGATSVETGQIQIQSVEYADEERIYQSFPVNDALLDSIATLSGVSAVTPRVMAHGIVGNEVRSRVTRVVGVDPNREREVSPIVDGLVEGRWLNEDPPVYPDPREVVLGTDLARQLQVGPGDELVVFLEAADGSLGNDLLEVVGIVRTGNSGIDRSTALLHLDDARTVTALEGEAHLVVLRTEDVEESRDDAARVAESILSWVDSDVHIDLLEAEANVDGLVVRPWQDVLPGTSQMIMLFRRSYWVLYIFIYLVAALGILNTQRMSALERRREFGVMLAIGVRPRRMFRILQVETVALGLLGALLGVALGGSLAWHHAVSGFDMSGLTSEASFTYMGVAFEERLHFVVSLRTLAQPALIMLGVSLVSGLWPAMMAARIDPAPTISGRGG